MNAEQILKLLNDELQWWDSMSKLYATQNRLDIAYEAKVRRDTIEALLNLIGRKDRE